MEIGLFSSFVYLFKHHLCQCGLMYIYFILQIIIQYNPMLLYFVLLNLFQLLLLGARVVDSWVPFTAPPSLHFIGSWVLLLLLALPCFLALQDTTGSSSLSPAPILGSVISPRALVPSVAEFY